MLCKDVFVEPLYVGFEERRPNDWRVLVEFRFRGPEIESRRIKVVVSAFDTQGKVLASHGEVQDNWRVAERKRLQQGDSQGRMIGYNYVQFRILPEAINQISRIETQFTEI
jgi:hypothetical protein